jgi:hypothetical protein
MKKHAYQVAFFSLVSLWDRCALSDMLVHFLRKIVKALFNYVLLRRGRERTARRVFLKRDPPTKTSNGIISQLNLTKQAHISQDATDEHLTRRI